MAKPLHPEDLERQAEVYGEIATVCLKHPGCTAIQTWGFTDNTPGLAGFTHRTQGDGLLFDRQYHEAGYNALHRALPSRNTQQQ